MDTILLLFFIVSWNSNAQNENLHFERIGFEEGISNET